MSSMRHGTIGRYSSKKYLCRCIRCRKAATAYQQDRRIHKPGVREKDRIHSRERNRKLRQYLQSRKTTPCKDCKNKYPPYVMHFDHLDNTTKEFVISQMGGRTIEKIDKEIAKCEVVCANCHAIRTHNRVARVQ